MRIMAKRSSNEIEAIRMQLFLTSPASQRGYFFFINFFCYAKNSFICNCHRH